MERKRSWIHLGCTKGVLKTKQKAGEELTLETWSSSSIGGVQKDIVSQILLCVETLSVRTICSAWHHPRWNRWINSSTSTQLLWWRDRYVSDDYLLSFFLRSLCLTNSKHSKQHRMKNIRTHMEGGDSRDKPRRQRTVDTSEFDEESAGQSVRVFKMQNDGEDLLLQNSCWHDRSDQCSLGIVGDGCWQSLFV